MTLISEYFVLLCLTYKRIISCIFLCKIRRANCCYIPSLQPFFRESKWTADSESHVRYTLNVTKEEVNPSRHTLQIYKGEK